MASRATIRRFSTMSDSSLAASFLRLTDCLRILHESNEERHSAGDRLGPIRSLASTFGQLNDPHDRVNRFSSLVHFGHPLLSLSALRAYFDARHVDGEGQPARPAIEGFVPNLQEHAGVAEAELRTRLEGSPTLCSRLEGFLPEAISKDNAQIDDWARALVDEALALQTSGARSWVSRTHPSAAGTVGPFLG